MRRLKPYLTAFRIRALLETQYRGAALGGLVTQMFFALVLACLYTARPCSTAATRRSCKLPCPMCGSSRCSSVPCL